MIINWCIVAIVALIMGGITSIATKDTDCFAVAIMFDIIVGFGCLLSYLI